MKKKYSYGLICFRQNDITGIEILMIKKSNTYHFCEFVSGHYKKYDDDGLLKLFNNMTYNEKIDILSLNFTNLWYKVYMEFPKNDINYIWKSSYKKKEKKFNNSFLHDNGIRLRKIIGKSKNTDTPWEFPKGRKNHKNESDIETAIREFYEETGIKSNKYNILWNIKPYIETYKDYGIIYKNTYYFAEAIDKWKPKYRFSNNTQISETSAVSWVSKNYLKSIINDNENYKRNVKKFTKIIKKIKNNKKKIYGLKIKKISYI